MNIFDPNRTDTPTQYDLARWLFERIEKIDPCKSRLEALELMDGCITAIRPAEKNRKGE